MKTEPVKELERSPEIQTRRLKLTLKQSALLTFIREQHEGQFRKYTEEPYWYHPLVVATIVSKVDETAIEAALCHDLFEDTKCTRIDLFSFMRKIGYSLEKSVSVCDIVEELTDVYTKENYPELNRTERKRLETIRLSSISEQAQNIKLADMADNLSSTKQFDPKFYKVYSKEKSEVLSIFSKCNQELLERVKAI